MSDKKTIFSGIQPSGKITLGNYLGAISNWVELQEEYNNYYCIVDMHAITVPQVPKDLRENTLLLLSQYLAAGIDPQKSTIFIQSHVPQHVELAWVLQTMTYMGELGRMTQYKDKSAKGGENLNSALFTYPVLMASDILLYSTDLVPVGEDQKQHLELARDVAQRFNNRYSETFKVPEVYIPKVGARVMSLQEPTKKMSKSDENENGYISLMDSNDVILKKVKRAVTDSVGVVNYSDDQPGIKNLLEICSKFENVSPQELAARYEGKGYGDFKADAAEIIAEGIRPVRDKANEYLADKAYLEEVYSLGAQKAEAVAAKMVSKVYKKIGFIPKKRI
ncbi:MAG: tryptophan--tRNA ligase [Proteocatella sp.]